MNEQDDNGGIPMYSHEYHLQQNGSDVWIKFIFSSESNDQICVSLKEKRDVIGKSGFLEAWYETVRGENRGTDETNPLECDVSHLGISKEVFEHRIYVYLKSNHNEMNTLKNLWNNGIRSIPAITWNEWCDIFCALDILQCEDALYTLMIPNLAKRLCTDKTCWKNIQEQMSIVERIGNSRYLTSAFHMEESVAIRIAFGTLCQPYLSEMAQCELYERMKGIWVRFKHTALESALHGDDSMAMFYLLKHVEWKIFKFTIAYNEQTRFKADKDTMVSFFWNYVVPVLKTAMVNAFISSNPRIKTEIIASISRQRLRRFIRETYDVSSCNHDELFERVKSVYRCIEKHADSRHVISREELFKECMGDSGIFAASEVAFLIQMNVSCSDDQVFNVQQASCFLEVLIKAGQFCILSKAFNMGLFELAMRTDHPNPFDNTFFYKLSKTPFNTTEQYDLLERVLINDIMSRKRILCMLGFGVQHLSIGHVRLFAKRLREMSPGDHFLTQADFQNNTDLCISLSYYMVHAYADNTGRMRKVLEILCPDTIDMLKEETQTTD